MQSFRLGLAVVAAVAGFGVEQAAAAPSLTIYGSRPWYQFPVPRTVEQELKVDQTGAKYSLSQMHWLAMTYVDSCVEAQQTAKTASTNTAMNCLDGWAILLANFHQRRAIDQKVSGEVEKGVTIAGISGLLLGGAARGAATANAWSVLAVGPLVWSQTFGTTPRQQLQFGASMSFRRLSEHYNALQVSLERVRNPIDADDRSIAIVNHEFDPGSFGPENGSAELTLAGDCANLSAQGKPILNTDLVEATQADPLKGVAVRQLQIDIKAANDYCAAFADADQAYAGFRLAAARDLQDLPGIYAQDIHKLDDVVRKVDEGFESTPAQVFSAIIASPFQTIANAVRSGSTPASVKDQTVSFDLEKDGLPLESPTRAALTAPAKPFPVIVIPQDQDLARLATAADAPTGLESTLENIRKFSFLTQRRNVLLNRVAADADQVAANYKMTFDFRQSKPTADVIAVSTPQQGAAAR